MRKTLLLLLFFFTTGTIEAHPHVFIKPDLKLISSPAGNELEVTWDLDAFFSASILAENNSRKDSLFTQAEVTSIRQNYFDNLKNFGYLMQLTIDRQNFSGLKVTSFVPRRQAQTVVYTFRFALPDKPRPYRLEVITFDKSGYVAFEDFPKGRTNVQIKSLKSDYFGSVDVQVMSFDVPPVSGQLR